MVLLRAGFLSAGPDHVLPTHEVRTSNHHPVPNSILDLLLPTIAKVRPEPLSLSAASIHQFRSFHAESQCTRSATAAALPMARLQSQILGRRLGTTTSSSSSSSTGSSSTTTATTSSDSNNNGSSIPASASANNGGGTGGGGNGAASGKESGGAKGYMKRRGVSEAAPRMMHRTCPCMHFSLYARVRVCIIIAQSLISYGALLLRVSSIQLPVVPATVECPVQSMMLLMHDVHYDDDLCDATRCLLAAQ